MILIILTLVFNSLCFNQQNSYFITTYSNFLLDIMLYFYIIEVLIISNANMKAYRIKAILSDDKLIFKDLLLEDLLLFIKSGVAKKLAYKLIEIK